MRARRRAVRQGAQHERTARRTTLGPIPYPEETVSRFLLWGAVALAALIIVLLSAGWYSSFYSPPRAIVGQVGGTEITLGDVIPYTLIEAIENGQFTPAGALNNMARDELLRQGAGELGLSVTEADVEAELASRFEPPSSNPDNPEPTALTSAGEANLDRYLADAQTNGVGVSEEQYRRWLEGQLLTAQAITHFNDALPDTLEQVRLRWIVAANSADADTALQRLAAEEPFADVAADLNTDTTLADEGGELGWVPPNAFPELEDYLFGEAFQVGLPTGPLQTSLGTLVIEVTEGPAEQPLSPAMRSLRGLNDLDEWLEQQTSLLLERLRLSNDQIEWVYKRLGVV
jgi:parvulin-like peptidyl-prolyl isomerase